MNVEIGAEAEQFPEKEYINGIAVAVRKVWFHNVAIFQGHQAPAWFYKKKLKTTWSLSLYAIRFKYLHVEYAVYDASLLLLYSDG